MGVPAESQKSVPHTNRSSKSLKVDEGQQRGLSCLVIEMHLELGGNPGVAAQDRTEGLDLRKIEE